jgi:hypothetical protein
VSEHVVRTTHIQHMVAEAGRLAKLVDNYGAWVEEPEDGEWPTDHRGHPYPVEEVLDRTANLLRHSAEEITDERLRCEGWRNG